MTATTEGTNHGGGVSNGRAERLPNCVPDGGSRVEGFVAGPRHANIDVGVVRTAITDRRTQGAPVVTGRMRQPRLSAFANDDEDAVHNDLGFGAYGMNQREQRTRMAAQRNDQLNSHVFSLLSHRCVVVRRRPSGVVAAAPWVWVGDFAADLCAKGAMLNCRPRRARGTGAAPSWMKVCRQPPLKEADARTSAGTACRALGRPHTCCLLRLESGAVVRLRAVSPQRGRKIHSDGAHSAHGQLRVTYRHACVLPDARIGVAFPRA